MIRNRHRRADRPDTALRIEAIVLGVLMTAALLSSLSQLFP